MKSEKAPIVIQKGDPVVIDMGVIVDGYCSDLTRTVVCGDKPSGKFREVFAVLTVIADTLMCGRLIVSLDAPVFSLTAHESSSLSWTARTKRPLAKANGKFVF